MANNPRILALGLCIGTAYSLYVAPIYAQTLNHIDVHTEDTQGETLKISLTTDGLLAPPKTFSLDNGNPRFILDIKSGTIHIDTAKTYPGRSGEKILPEHILSGQESIKKIRYAKRGKGYRLVFDLAAPLKSKDINTDGKVWTLRFTNPSAFPHKSQKLDAQIPDRTDTPNTPGTSVRKAPPHETSYIGPVPRLKPVPSKPAQLAAASDPPRHALPNNTLPDNGIPIPRLQPRRQKAIVKAAPIKRPLIAIDAGHGGYDPGAIGRNGLKEKHVTFSAAQNLAKKLRNTGLYDVVLTRDKDVYVAHGERIRRARRDGADLFISIHADSAGSSSARGASVYTLADRAKNRTQEIIDTQNWVLDVQLDEQSDPVGDILVDLAQRKTFSQSDEFANILLPHIGRKSALVGNSHRRAGYFVLLAPDVPAVLLELGFLSNSQDENLLKDQAHIDKLMNAVTDAIHQYFSAPNRKLGL